MNIFKCPLCSTTIEAPDEIEGQLVDCPACSQSIEVPYRKSSLAERALAFSNIIVTTTGFIENRPVEAYLGIVTAEVIYGANLFRDLMASIHDVIGGRVPKYEELITAAKEEAIKTLREKAAKLKADALLGLSIDCEVLGQQNSMLMITAQATAVSLTERSVTSGCVTV